MKYEIYKTEEYIGQLKEEVNINILSKLPQNEIKSMLKGYGYTIDDFSLINCHPFLTYIVHIDKPIEKQYFNLMEDCLINKKQNYIYVYEDLDKNIEKELEITANKALLNRFRDRENKFKEIYFKTEDDFIYGKTKINYFNHINAYIDNFFIYEGEVYFTIDKNDKRQIELAYEFPIVEIDRNEYINALEKTEMIKIVSDN